MRFDGSFKDSNVGYGGIITIAGREIEYCGAIDHRAESNSVIAEWISLINGLTYILVLFPNVVQVRIEGDAKTVIDTLNRRKRPKSKGLRPYYHLVISLLDMFEGTSAEWVSEKSNKRADRASKAYRR